MNARVIKICNSTILEQLKQKYLFENIENKFYAVELTDLNLSTSEKIKSVFSEAGFGNLPACTTSEKSCDILLSVSLDNLPILEELFNNCNLNLLADKIKTSVNNFIGYNYFEFEIRNKKLKLDSALVMGILNVTPDSFSDGGKFNSIENALAHAASMINDGAEIIDIGGESTRPGAEKISVDEELKRVIPVVESIRKNYKNISISIDTTKSSVAEAALKAGADIVNDISGATFDANMFNVVSNYNSGLVLMHIQGTPDTMQINPGYNDVMSEVYNFFADRIKAAEEYGINKIIVDPGIGFGKRIEDNYTLINRLEEFKSLGYPILMGLSRKSFFGKSLNLEVNERDNATTCADSVSLNNGARIIRTHNVKNAVEAVKIFNFTNSIGQIVNA